MNAAVPFTLLRGGITTPHRQATRAPDPHQPPPPSRAATDRLAGDFAAMLLLIPVEAGAAKAAELDEELFACCGEAMDADEAAGRAMDGVDTIPFDDPAMDYVLAAAVPFLDAYEASVRGAAQLPARTPEGLQAKARLLLHQIEAGVKCEALAASLARDVVGRVAV